ncbi:MAG: hypothetical protein C4554_03910 [Dethiobacter sp.]|jgi:hypothetical protein|nr:MAG: hypothetical protein C4554_03910 [Dethiobacter sp.]
MRKPLITKEGRFDPASVRPQMEKVIDAFDRYLEVSPYRLGRTKHAVMGPVAKILERSLTGSWSVNDLAGYALRVHEMHPATRGFVSTEARIALETGIQELMELINMVPVTARAKVLEKVEFGLYYCRRKRASEWMERIRKDFEHFLQSRYESVDAFREAWKDKNATFGAIYPSIKNDAYKKSKGMRKADIDEFWLTYGKEDIEEEEE